MKIKRLIDNTDIITQKVFLKWYARLPFIISCAIIILSLISGIIIAINTSTISGFLAGLGTFFIGCVISCIFYILLKLYQSHQILTVAYLQHLCKDNINSTSTEKSTDFSQLKDTKSNIDNELFTRQSNHKSIEDERNQQFELITQEQSAATEETNYEQQEYKEDNERKYKTKNNVLLGIIIPFAIFAVALVGISIYIIISGMLL